MPDTCYVLLWECSDYERDEESSWLSSFEYEFTTHSKLSQAQDYALHGSQGYALIKGLIKDYSEIPQQWDMNLFVSEIFVYHDKCLIGTHIRHDLHGWRYYPVQADCERRLLHHPPQFK